MNIISQRILFLVIFSFTVSVNYSYSQVQQEWISRLDIDNGSETLVKDMTVDANGNVYVTGCSPVENHGRDFVTVKYNSAGEQQWVSYYNGSGSLNDVADCILIDESGNVFVGGSSYSQNELSDFLLVKYNSSGVEQWVRRYNGPGDLDDGICDIGVDDEGNIFVTGGSWGIPAGLTGTGLDYATIKYSNSGDEQWVKRYNGQRSSWDESFKLVLDSDGNVIVTGYSMEIAGQSDDFTTVKYNSSGAQMWVSHFDGPYHSTDHAKSLSIDRNNNIYVTGFTPTMTDHDIVILKYDASGIQKWSAIYNGNGSGWDHPVAIANDTSGNVYVSGMNNGAGSAEDFLTVKFDSAGIFKWAETYNNSFNGADRLEGMVADNGGNVYVTGYSLSAPTTFNFLTIKYNTFGQQQWAEQFHEKRNIAEYGRAIAIDKNSNVYVSGYTFGNIPEDNIVTIKYSQTVSVLDPSVNQISNFSLKQNYPNPFNPKTVITYELPGNTDFEVKLTVYNVLGIQVATLINTKQNAGRHSIDFDASQFASGNYFYKVEALSSDSRSNFFEVKSMVLLK